MFSNHNGIEGSLNYCWIIDGNESLNIYLVENGCCYGGTMLRPKTWKEISKSERKFYRKTGMEKPNVKILIKKKVYTEFIEKVKEAEKYAIKNKLGIWNKK